MLTDFQNTFADRLTSKFAIKWLLNIPSHLKHVATLACETLMMVDVDGSSHLSADSQPYGIGQTIIFLPCGFFFFLLSFFLSSPNLSRRRLYVCHTSTHGVVLVRICDAGLKPAARGSLEMQGPKSRQKSLSGHHRTTLSGYIFTTEECIDNRKKTCCSNMSSRCSHNMVNFGPLVAEIGLPVWGTPGNFNGIRVLAALLHGSQVVGVS